MNFDAVVDLVMTKLGGAIIGAALALLYLQPKTFREFLTRLAFSVVCGFAFSDQLQSYLGWAPTETNNWSSAIAAAGLSWFVWGAIVSGADKLIGKK